MKTHLSVSALRTIVTTNGIPACGVRRGQNHTLQSTKNLTLAISPLVVTCAHCQRFIQNHQELFPASLRKSRALAAPAQPQPDDHLTASDELLKRAVARLKSAGVRGSFIQLLDRVRLLVTKPKKIPSASKFSEVLAGITAKRGLLWRGGETIPLPEADHIAHAAGYLNAERLVTALSQ